MKQEVNFNRRAFLMCAWAIAVIGLSLWVGSGWTTRADDGNSAQQGTGALRRPPAEVLAPNHNTGSSALTHAS